MSENAGLLSSSFINVTNSTKLRLLTQLVLNLPIDETCCYIRVTDAILDPSRVIIWSIGLPNTDHFSSVAKAGATEEVAPEKHDRRNLLLYKRSRCNSRPI